MKLKTFFPTRPFVGEVDGRWTFFAAKDEHRLWRLCAVKAFDHYDDDNKMFVYVAVSEFQYPAKWDVEQNFEALAAALPYGTPPGIQDWTSTSVARKIMRASRLLANLRANDRRPRRRS